MTVLDFENNSWFYICENSRDESKLYSYSQDVGHNSISNIHKNVNSFECIIIIHIGNHRYDKKSSNNLNNY